GHGDADRSTGRRTCAGRGAGRTSRDDQLRGDLRDSASRSPALSPRWRDRPMTALTSLVERSDVLRVAREALREHEPHLVGGSVRDLLMERLLVDFDLVVPERSEAAARELAHA